MSKTSDMKYIRTKDGIYELMFPNEEQQMSFDHKTIEPAYYTTKNEWVAKKDVIAQADNIEELCDMFVVWQEGVMPVEMPLTEKEQYEKMKKIVSTGMKAKMNIWLKVAIWADKGLIYVAKMNDEGELELL